MLDNVFLNSELLDRSSGTHFCNVRFQLLDLPGLQVLISALLCGYVLLCSVVQVVIDIEIIVLNSLIFECVWAAALPRGLAGAKLLFSIGGVGLRIMYWAIYNLVENLLPSGQP